MRSAMFRVLVLLGLVVSGVSTAHANDVMVVNQSSWQIHYLYMSPTSQDTWGDDHLGDSIINTNAKFTLRNVSCDTYDMKVVDEDGDVCVIAGQRFCESTNIWTITSDNLLSCQEQTASQGSVGSAASGSTSVTINNGSSYAIYQMFMSPTSQETWGDDHLGDNIIMTGGTFTLPNVSCNNYDIKLVDQDNDKCVIPNVRMCEGASTFDLTNENLIPCYGEQGVPGASSSSGATVTFNNQSSYGIHYLYMSPTSQDTWGDDHLGDQILNAGGTFSLPNVPCNSYDIRLKDEDNDECVLNSVQLCGDTTTFDLTNENLLSCYGQPSPFDGGSASTVTFNNNSSYGIHYLYMSPTSDDSWGSDRLGSNEIIQSGSSFSIQNVSCDNYDIKLLDEDMDECVVNGVELCGENAVFELTNDNLLSCQGYGQ